MSDAVDILLKIVGEHADSRQDANFYELYQGLTLDVIGNWFRTLPSLWPAHIMNILRSMWPCHEGQLSAGQDWWAARHDQKEHEKTGENILKSFW